VTRRNSFFFRQFLTVSVDRWRISLCAVNQGFLLLVLLFPGLIPQRHLGLLMTTGVLGVLFVPGELVLRRMGVRPKGWDAVPYAFGASMIIVTGFTVLCLETRLKPFSAALALLASTLLLAVLEHTRGTSGTGTDAEGPSTLAERLLQGTLFATLGVLTYMLFTVGGSISPGSIGDLQEEALHLTILRKLAQNPVLDHFNLMYKPGVAMTYVYPPYHFALALVSRISGLDPIVVYLKFRAVAALVSLLSMRALAAILFGRRWIADLTLFALLILVFNNAAGQIADFYWAQLLPVSHLGDFGLGVMFPVMILFLFRYVLGEPNTPFRILAPLVVFVGLLVHTREVLQLLLFLSATAVAYFIFDVKEARILGRILCMISFTVIVGMLYKVRQNHLASHAVLFEAANRAQFWERLRGIVTQPVLEVLTRPNPEFYGLMGRPFFLFPLFLLPFLWFWRPRFWALFLASGLFSCALLIRVPYLSILFIVVTYAEMLVTPARYLFHWGYLLLGVGCACAALLLERAYACAASGARLRLTWADEPQGQGFEAGWGRLPMALGLVFTAASFALGWMGVLALGWLGSETRAHLDWLYFHAIVGSLLCLALLWRFKRIEVPHVSGDQVHHPWAVLVFALGLLTPVFGMGIGPSLFSQYQRWSRQPPLSDFWEWYATSPFAENLPGPLVRFIRQLPPGQIFAAPYPFVFAIPVVANQHVISCGHILSTELDFTVPYGRAHGLPPRVFSDTFSGYQERTAYAQMVLAQTPIFRTREPPEDTIAYLREYGVQYVVTGPAQLERFKWLRRMYPSVLEQIYERQQRAVYRVHREAFGPLSP